MLDRLFGFKIHDYLQVLGLFILAVGVPLNKVLMSIGTIWLASNLVLKADFKGYWKKWKNSRVFWFVALLFVLHFLGLIYTDDFSYALKDFNTKLPFFVIPIALIAFPIQHRFFKSILYGFLTSLFITSVINFIFMMNNEAEDYRNFSLFGSHIRYALLIVTGLLISVYLWIENKKQGLLYLILSSWFLYYTIVSQVFSGYIVLIFLLLGFFLFFIKQFQLLWIKYLTVVGVITLCFVGCFQVYEYLKPTTTTFVFGDLPEKTEFGERYYHDTTILWFENGHHITSFIAGKELKSSWNQRSSIAFDTKLDGGYSIGDILVRYMASKGLTKDKRGMHQMSDQDISNVENGVASINYNYGTIRKGLAKLKNEIFHYSIGGDPDGNSLLQRLEHWKTGKEIIKQNWVFGVGTGDVQNAFNRQYTQSESQLDKNNWNRAHNQFMTFWITFGLTGFILFIGFWLWFLWKNIRMNNLIGIGFTLIAIASFLSEDTLETQQGVTFISLFLGICSMMNTQFVSIRK